MSENQKWEYAVQEFRTADAGGLQASVNKFVKEGGWELVSVNLPLHYFKAGGPHQQWEYTAVGVYRGLNVDRIDLWVRPFSRLSRKPPLSNSRSVASRQPTPLDSALGSSSFAWTEPPTLFHHTQL